MITTDACRCAALYRVSTLKQARRHADADESLPVQRQAVRDFLRRYHPGWTLVAEFAEEGVSAYRAPSADRDVLQDVLQAAAHRRFEVLLVFKADRLSRQALEYPLILAQLARAGVRVISVADAPGGRVLEVEGQFEKLIRFVEGWQAETESYNTSVRVSAAMEQMARQGRWTGGTPPYGFRYTADRRGPVPLEIHPAEAEVLRQIFGWYLREGIGTVLIAERLNRAGLRARRGGPWTDLAVRRIMQNPAITGRLPYGRKARNAHGRLRLKPRSAWDTIILGPPMPALTIIPIPDWEAAMDRMAAYNRREPAGATRHSRSDSGGLLFTGLARCAACGGPLVVHHGVNVSRSRAGVRRTPRLQYVCYRQFSQGRDACPGQRTFSQRKVEGTLVPAILRMLQQLDRAAVVQEARRLAEQSLFQQRALSAQRQRQLAEARRIRDGWLQRVDAFLADPAASLYSEAVLAAKVRDAEARVQALEAEEAAWQAAEGALADQLADLERFLADSASWWQRFLEAPRLQQKALLRQIIDHVDIGRDGYDIYYRLDWSQLTGRAQPPVTWHAAGAWAASRASS